MTNAINVIHPYKSDGLWVFDDDKAGLAKEPFIAGADTIIDNVIRTKGIRNANDGFRLIFSANPFPGYDMKLLWLRAADGGNWYRAEGTEMEGWLCPALFRYFADAPNEIYARFEEKAAG